MASQYTDAVLLLGDSLTQEWGGGSIAQRLSNYWLRRLDVLNRGFGGYNSDWGVPVFEQVFPTQEDRKAGRAQDVQLLTIWFGANDAVLDDRPQYVPLDRYKANLRTMVENVRSKNSKWHAPGTRIVLISCPPIIEEERVLGQLRRWREFGSQGPEPTLDREFERTKRYAMAAVEVGKELGVPTVDMWNAVVDAAGGIEREKLAPFFTDGLHLTPLGYNVLFEELTKLVLQHWPELEPEKIPMRLPHWGDIDPKNPRDTIGGHKPKIPRHDEL